MSAAIATHCRSLLILVAGLAYGANLNFAQAGTTDWIHTNGNSSWFNLPNWSAGVPASSDNAFISSGTTAFVEGATVAVADNVYIDTGGLTIGNISAGTLNVNGELAVSANGSGGALKLNYGTISLNRLSVGQGGSYADTSYGTLLLTGNDPTIAMAPDVTVLINSLITGTNGFVKSGLGTLILANNNSYAGGTTINIGMLQIGNGGASGSLGDGDVLNNGNLVFNRGDNITVTNFISGSGNLTHAGAGRFTLTADNTYSGGTTISSGTLQVGDGGATGSLGSGNVTNNGTLAFNRNDDITIGSAISGTGNLQELGTNILTLTGNNTYAGSTTINSNGTVQVGNGGTTGTLGSGAVVNHGALALNRSDTLTMSNTISGTGNLTNAGSGTSILTASNTYSGLTVIAAGTVQVGDGGDTGSLGTNQVINNGSLAFNRSNDVTVANLIIGSGSLTHVGTGTLTLSGTNTFSGGTSVNNGGTLQLRDSSAAGTGGLNLNNGRLRADPSRTGGLEIKVGGNYLQGADGTLELGIGGTSLTNYDHLDIDGTATLDGTLHVVQFNGYVPHHNDEQVLVAADGGVTGEFATFTNEIPYSLLLDPQLLYSSNRVTLFWEQLSFIDFLVSSNGVNLTANQSAVGHALDSIASSTDSNDAALIDHLDYLSDLTNSLPVAFDLAAPEELTAMMTAAFVALEAQGQQFRIRANQLREEYRAVLNAILGERARDPELFKNYLDRPWEVYVNLPINSASVPGDGNAAGYDLNSFGFTVGADRRLNDQFVVGGALGFLSTDSGLSSGGKLDLNSFNAQAYATWVNSGWYLEGMLGFAVNSYNTERASVDGMADGSASGFGFTGLIGGGYDWRIGFLKVGPRVGLEYLTSTISEFTESGSLAPLLIQSQNGNALMGSVGLNVSYAYYLNPTWTVITPEFYLGWRQNLIDHDPTIDAQFASGAGEVFTVTGAEYTGDSFVIGLGVSVQWRPSFNTYLNFVAQSGQGGYAATSLNLGVRYRF